MSCVYNMLTIATLSLAAVTLVSAQSNDNCASGGINIQDLGTYYFNLLSPAQFSFTTDFFSCTGYTTPTLQFPDGTVYTCSPTDMDLGLAETTCQLVAGGLYIITFPEIGRYRRFTVTNTQQTVTETSTITATATVTPVATLEELITNTVSDTTTLPTPTTTLPAATKGTVTLSPMVTITTTHSTIRTFFVTTTILTTSTITKNPTLPCTTVAQASAHIDHVTAVSLVPRIARRLHPTPAAFLPRRGLFKRDGPDGDLTTTTTSLVATATVVTLPVTTTTTNSSTIDVTITITVTPATFTTFSGTVKNTVTKPTKTVTSTVRTKTTIVATKMKTKSFKATFTSAPTAC